MGIITLVKFTSDEDTKQNNSYNCDKENQCFNKMLGGHNLIVAINEEHKQACLFNVRVPLIYGNPYIIQKTCG